MVVNIVCIIFKKVWYPLLYKASGKRIGGNIISVYYGNIFIRDSFLVMKHTNCFYNPVLKRMKGNNTDSSAIIQKIDHPIQ